MRLNGCRAKLRRAGQHIDALESEVGSFFEAHPYRVSVEHGLEQIFVVKLIDPPKPPYEQWGLVIGDAVHNIRSSLDYIAWELAGANPNDRETQFPIFDTKTGWDQRAARRIKNLPPAAKALVQEMQPYHGGHPDTAALSVIRRLDDADKHKVLTVTAAVQESISLTLNQPPGSRVRNPSFALTPNVALEHDAVIAVVDLRECSADVDVDAEFTPLVSFGDGWDIPPRTLVVPSLRAMLTEATTVADTFEARFAV